MGTALRTAGGGGSAKQPVANIFRLGLFVSGDNSYGAGRANAYTGNFTESGSILICNTSGTYRVKAYGSFRYGYLHLQVNGETKLTVNGYSVGGGGIATAEGEIILNAGDTVSFVASHVNAIQTRFEAGNATIYRKG